jgi:hypothetical protein
MRYCFSIVLFACAWLGTAGAQGQADRPASAKSSPHRALVAQYCLDCHNSDDKSGGLAFDKGLFDVSEHTDVWEKVVRKLRARQMPPPDADRPGEKEYQVAVASLESALDAAAAERPEPGRTETFRRLNRTEYQNTIRDLLALNIDVEALLPPDESSHGFDNITVADLSPALLNRYISAAQKISRQAVGRAPGSLPEETTFRVRPDVTQDTHIEGLPLGTRGGILIPFNFPQDGEYEIQVRLMRDRNEEMEGLREPHELEVLLDRKRVELFTVKPPSRGQTHRDVDAHLKTRIKTSAGPHDVGAAFLRKSAPLLETTRQPLNVHYNFYRHPRIGPAVYQVSIIGPFDASGPGETPSRKRIFISTPKDATDEEDCATRILSNLARRAYRRPVDEEDLKPLLEFYRDGRAEGGFEAGIESALASMLVNPQFLFRIQQDPIGAAPGTAYKISDVELASRLSYFLWSSMPDDELLDLAESGKLSRDDVLEQQVRRMLADGRSRSLVSNFAGQWLYLRNLDSIIPDMRLYPDFDDNLRQAMRQETELFFESIIREDKSALDLVKADYTYLNERLAKHYGIPNVYGSRFRRVSLDEASQRGGLLRHASILTVTSYATRTSPVLRGNWVLKNFIGTPPPPPPPDVPDLADNAIAATLSVRERLKQHRADAACASCHQLMDPIGFALENYDAIGHWRELEAGQPIDVSGGLPDGSEFAGVEGLERALVARPELFVQTLTEKLLTFALGRGVEYYDAPAVRKIVAAARDDNYRFSRLIVGIVKSTPFQMRKSQ